MRMVAFLLILFFIGILFFHAKTSSEERAFRVGVDPYFYTLNFQGQEKWISAFVEELLLKIAHKEGVEIEEVQANWDTLLEDLGKRYDAVVAAIRPYNFREENYQFSPVFLATDPVLILPAKASYSSLEKMSGQIVGVEKGSKSLLIVQKYPHIFIKEYGSLAELLQAVDEGEIDGAVAGQIPVATYLKDLYAGRLKMSDPLTEQEGLRFILLKNEKRDFLAILNRGLKALETKPLLELQRKWNLHP